MGKHRHTQDRLYISATEWKKEYGGHREAANGNRAIRPLPFDQCALSLTPFETPVCTKEGVLFDITNLVPYIKEHHKNPVTGAAMSIKDMIRLKMTRNAEGQWHCPVTYKAFTDTSHVVAIKTTGNVYLFEAVQELNYKAKNFTDLLTGEDFTRADVITLQDPANETHRALRDINNFVHLRQLREENAAAVATAATATSSSSSSSSSSSAIRHTPQTAAAMAAVVARGEDAASLTRRHDAALPENSSNMQQQAMKAGVATNALAYFGGRGYFIDDVRDVLALNPLVQDVDVGNVQTDQRASSSFTSSASGLHTSNASRLATPEEVRDAKWKRMRQLKKKAFVQLQTTAGNLNLEVHCDIAPRASYNFLSLCAAGYYDGTPFHRLIPGFMVQGGDPTGTGTGGESAFGGKKFRDEFDSRLVHGARGVVSMANSGSNTNGSQFFITFAPAAHLDLVHVVFARVVGGLAALATIEGIGNKSGSGSGSGGAAGTAAGVPKIGKGKDKDSEEPAVELKLLHAVVFTSPVQEAEEVLLADVTAAMARRKAQEAAVSKAVKGVKSSTVTDAAAAAAAGGGGGVSGSAGTRSGQIEAGGSRDRERGEEEREEEAAKRVKTAHAGGSSAGDSVQQFMASEGVRTQEDILAARRRAMLAAPAGGGGGGAAGVGGHVFGGATGGVGGMRKPAVGSAAAAAAGGGGGGGGTKKPASSSYGNFNAF